MSFQWAICEIFSSEMLVLLFYNQHYWQMTYPNLKRPYAIRYKGINEDILDATEGCTNVYVIRNFRQTAITQTPHPYSHITENDFFFIPGASLGIHLIESHYLLASHKATLGLTASVYLPSKYSNSRKLTMRQFIFNRLLSVPYMQWQKQRKKKTENIVW